MSLPELNPTKLGTRDYWDSVYKEEISNFGEFADEGEIWFGADTMEKVVLWTLEHAPSQSNPSILEIGSGNGMLLHALVEAGFNPDHLQGIDYSLNAIQLAKFIANARGEKGLTFTLCDILNQDPSILPHMDGLDSWDVIIDKGTFDAIALGIKDEHGRSPAVGYPQRVARLLKPGGLFLITSCNFTENELQTAFVTSETSFLYHSRIQHPTYTFGGKTGSIVASLAFRKSVS